jgi:hypothetical protein
MTWQTTAAPTTKNVVKNQINYYVFGVSFVVQWREEQGDFSLLHAQFTN